MTVKISVKDDENSQSCSSSWAQPSKSRISDGEENLHYPDAPHTFRSRNDPTQRRRDVC